MKKFLAIVLALTFLALGVSAASEPVNPFTDVNESSWYAKDVLAAYAMGLVSGKSETEFKPDDNLTYAEAIKLAACMNQKYVDGVVTLENGSPWYQSYVDYCKEKGIIGADYKYDDYATRVGYMYIFACALPDEAYEEINNIPDGSIPDVPADAPYAAVVYKLYRAGIVTGVDLQRNCNPTANIKRSEVAVIIARMMDKSKRVKFSIGEEVVSLENKDVEIKGNESVEVGHNHDFVIENDKWFHWEECECGEYKNEEEHEYKDGVCVVCGHKEDGNDKPYTESGNVEIENKYESIVVYPNNNEAFEYENGDLTTGGEITSIYIEKNPVSIEVEGYTSPGTLEVKANGGRRPYTYQWKYREGRGDTYDVVDTFEVNGAQTEKLTIYTNPNDKHTGLSVYCTVTDADGNSVNSTTAAVYGPLSMKIEERTLAGTDMYELVGRLDDGMLRAEEAVAIKRNDKIIAIGIVKEIKMFGRNIDVVTKGDYCGIIFRLDDGYTPAAGDKVLRYRDFFEIDGSDIVN